MIPFQQIDPSLLFSKSDPDDQRLGDIVELMSPSQAAEKGFEKGSWVITGYADDEGIKLNGGRVGAAQGPDAIRTHLYKMTPHFNAQGPTKLVDFGNLAAESEISLRHDAARQTLHFCHEAGAKTIGLGGGHDYAYADGEAFIDWCVGQGERPLILNFDAHLDVRPMDRGPSSGTPFFRLLSEHADEIDFAEIGIQSQCASKSHIAWAHEHQARILMLEDILASGSDLTTVVMQFLQSWLGKRPAYLSIDIDGFASAYAMGCSQSFATGFDPNAFFILLRNLSQQLSIQALGVYEVSPPFDQDGRTAKLAAQIIHQLLYQS